jgi:probable F420-dependent oxidoreductase
MRLGTFLPNLGPVASIAGIRAVAERAEALGFDSVWVTERLFQPVNPSVPFAGDPEGTYPEAYRYVLDPVVALTCAAACTTRVRLGTSVLIGPYYNPVLLARALTAVDVVSDGRLEVGLGVGWHVDEFHAVGVDMATRGRRMDEVLVLLKALWTENPVAFDGGFFQLREASVLPKPIQDPHPPILIGAYTEAALRRAATKADGIQPPGTLPLPELAALINGYRAMVRESGGDPRAARVVLRAQVDLRDERLPDGRVPFSGAPDQVTGDIAAAATMGVTDLICDSVYFAGDLAELLDSIEQVKAMVDETV